MAESSDVGFRAAETHLEAAKAQAMSDDMASRYRTQLAAAARTALGPDRADLFMRAQDPRLGMSPFDRCTDSLGLRACMQLLPKR